jgi:hypothetical protein
MADGFGHIAILSQRREGAKAITNHKGHKGHEEEGLIFDLVLCALCGRSDGVVFAP